jgi:hypothetical protein
MRTFGLIPSTFGEKIYTSDNLLIINILDGVQKIILAATAPKSISVAFRPDKKATVAPKNSYTQRELLKSPGIVPFA